MKCPVCQTPDLLMTERAGIEIDYCPTCRGVWLDRGELDKLIARTVDPGAAAMRNRSPDPHEAASERERWHDARPDRRYPYRKKKSMLGELFDFD
jgi:Zn-finger nucleic acid-binding protein